MALGGLLAASLQAQDWPLPAATPNTPTKCSSSCPGGLAGKPTYGWNDPVVAFTGRFLDSAYMQDWQQTFRTARAGRMKTNPAGDRIYFALGQAVAAYDASTFFSRLESNEPLMWANAVPVSPGNSGINPPPIERFLNFNRFFYAENTPSGWITPAADGQDRLFDFDIDDRGIVYLAYSMFGWGTAKDDVIGGGLMAPSYQDPNSLDYSPRRIFWVKSSTGSYYAYVGKSGNPTLVFNVDDYLHPVSRGTVGESYSDSARGGSHIALINDAGQLKIFDDDAFIAGKAPITTQVVSTATTICNYLSVVYDGTNFWAAGYVGPTYSGVLSKYAPNASGGYTRTDYALCGPNDMCQVMSLRYRDGYLGMGVQAIAGTDQRLFDISSSEPVEYPLNGVFLHYYSSPPTGYIRAPRSIPGMLFPWVRNGKLYVVIPAVGLGDVWQLRSNRTPQQQSCGTLVAGSNVAAGFTGPVSGCSAAGGTCSTIESIAFSVAFSGGYDAGCATHTYTWQFDDGTTANGASVSKALSAGTHNVSCTVYNGTQTVSVSTVVTVAAPPPPTQQACATMAVNQSVFGSYLGSTSGCKETGGTCTAGESITFSIYYWQFAPTCTTTYTWQFDDGTTATGQSITHSFASGGTHTATCTVANSAQSVQVPLTVNLSGSTSLPAPTVALDYSFLGAGKYQFMPRITGGTVTTFAWDFGDGVTSTTLDTTPVQHTYTKAGAVTMTLQAGNASASTLVARTINVDLGTALHGDANNDGAITSADVFYLINYLFHGGPAPTGNADANGDGVVNSQDLFYLMNYVFSGGPGPH